jgi:hypothetical protein
VPNRITRAGFKITRLFLNTVTAYLKKIVSISLLFLFLFNLFGYRLLISYLERRADTQLIAQLNENNFDESRLISIKVPAIHFSDYVNARPFERVDGQIEIKGVMYNYVKRKLFNDSLELICIPNTRATKLRSADSEFFKLVNGLTQKEDKKTTTLITKNISADYIASGFLLGWLAGVFIAPTYNADFSEALSYVTSMPAEDPPEGKIN